MDADVVIIGAGPAGVAAALTLHRAGRVVTLIDKAEFPRDKICGDGLTTSALRELEALGLEPDAIESWQQVHDVIIRGPKGHSQTFPLPRERGQYAAIATRLDLDAALVDLAVKDGVDVRQGQPCLGATQGSEAITVTTPEGSITARYAIGADGMWSPLRKMLGLREQDYRGEWHAFRQYFSGVQQPSTDLAVFFEADFLPGYFWSFPLPGDRANVGFGIRRGEGHQVGDMKELWNDLLSRRHVVDLLGPDATAEGPHRAWPIPARIDNRISGSGRVFFVGDAVSACDVLTGEGIGQALITGRRSAEIINSRWADPVGCQFEYRRWLDADFGPDHRMSQLLGRAMRHRKGARAAVRVAGINGWTRRNFARWLFEDYSRGLAFTPSRWSLGSLRGDGAYR